MSKVLVKFRLLALLVLTGASLSACLMMGEAVYTSTISVEFPGTSKEAALELALDAAREQGYKRGTYLLLDGKPLEKVCSYSSTNFSSCQGDFLKRAERFEAPIEKIADRPETWESEDSLRVSTEKTAATKTYAITPKILARQHRSGSEVRFQYSSFLGEMNDENKADFYRLKQALISRWGDKVSTQDEPNEIEP
jgi:hypothetical protein